MKPPQIQTSISEDEEMLAHVQRSGKHDSNHVSSSLVTIGIKNVCITETLRATQHLIILNKHLVQSFCIHYITTN